MTGSARTLLLGAMLGSLHYTTIYYYLPFLPSAPTIHMLSPYSFTHAFLTHALPHYPVGTCFTPKPAHSCHRGYGATFQAAAAWRTVFGRAAVVCKQW